MGQRFGTMEGLGQEVGESLMIDRSFWRGKKVFVTGHSGFKGAWLSIFLHSLGAEVKGYSLAPPTNPSLYDLCRIHELVHSEIADIRDGDRLKKSMATFNPDVVFHMAAQPLVRESYLNPVDTYSVNVMGTVNLFEAVRNCSNIKSVVNVTTDKCYENKEWVWGYRENERLGGYDPYSNSKACSELVTSSYRSSYFNPDRYGDHGVGIASARAGNVIGGGDWAKDRLIPDCLGSLTKAEKIVVRNPQAIRPWQHVLEPLSGYLTLAQKLYADGPTYGGAWNFGPAEEDARKVLWIVEKLCAKWGGNASFDLAPKSELHEAHFLKLDCSKARAQLGWHPKWNLDQSLDRIIEWTKAFSAGSDVRNVCLDQITDYITSQDEE